MTKEEILKRRDVFLEELLTFNSYYTDLLEENDTVEKHIYFSITDIAFGFGFIDEKLPLALRQQMVILYKKHFPESAIEIPKS